MAEERVWIPDREWRLLDPWEPKKCRRPRCPNPAVAELERWSYSRNKPYPWAYCDAHLYGRRVHAGVVEVALPADSPAVERGYWDLRSPAQMAGTR